MGPESLTIVANWKKSGTGDEARAWVEFMVREKHLLVADNQIIVCPPITALSTVASEIRRENLNIAVGVQNIDLGEDPKDTGGISPELVAEYASYVILGHSERRKNHLETDEVVARKVELATKHNLVPIVCVEDLKQAIALSRMVGHFRGIVAYEPPGNIGGTVAASPEEANAMARQIREVLPNDVLYGGSVNKDNAGLLLAGGLVGRDIKGFLVGNRSLDGSFFAGVINNAR